MFVTGAHSAVDIIGLVYTGFISQQQDCQGPVSR